MVTPFSKDGFGDAGAPAVLFFGKGKLYGSCLSPLLVLVMNSPCSISLLGLAIAVDDVAVAVAVPVAVAGVVGVVVAAAAIDCSANNVAAGTVVGVGADAGFDKIEFNANNATGASVDGGVVAGVVVVAVAGVDGGVVVAVDAVAVVAVVAVDEGLINLDNANRAAAFDGVTDANGDDGDAGDDGEVLFKLDNANRVASVDDVTADTCDCCMDGFVCGVCDSFVWSAFNANAMTGDID